MKQKKHLKNKPAKKDVSNPFNEMWFWLGLASIEFTDFIQSKDERNDKQNHSVEMKKSHSIAP